MNTCGECRECCIHLPIAVPELQKSAGVPCRHLCDNGCRIHDAAGFPSVCAGFLCAWREYDWLAGKPDYRPDKLGVIFYRHGSLLVVTETRLGALASNPARYVKSRLERFFSQTKVYPFGVMDGIEIELDNVQDGEAYVAGIDFDGLGTRELTAKRVPLPMAG